jgi:hypothetical protein
MPDVLLDLPLLKHYVSVRSDSARNDGFDYIMTLHGKQYAIGNRDLDF